MSKKPLNPGDRLRVLRAEHRLSQMEVAQHLGCGHHRYWRIENGYQEPGADEIAILAKLFKTEAKELFPALAA